ncbi:MAG: phosphatase PAP2 family protein [Alicyclobacillus sp.]|nr:phosphatase PAP2 family protein [Alicyclobacillus sp.]
MNGFSIARIGHKLRALELFEWLGAAATAAALVIFWRYAGALDQLAGVPGYHWRVVGLIAGIYGRFIPCAVAVTAGLIALVSWRMQSSRRGQVWRRYGYALRLFLPYCALLIVFRIVNFYVPVLHPGLRDAALQQLDAHWFGKQIAQWLVPYVNPWLTHLATAAYVSWFWLLFFTLLMLALTQPDVAAEYVLASLLAFYTGYVCYVLVPVVGPGYTLTGLPPVGDIAPRPQADLTWVARDCFPSLHTALTVIMTLYIGRCRKHWLWLYVPWGAFIVGATLYLRFHYGWDDVAGAALGVVMSYVAPAFQAWWRPARVAAPISSPPGVADTLENSAVFRHT